MSLLRSASFIFLIGGFQLHVCLAASTDDVLMVIGGYHHLGGHDIIHKPIELLGAKRKCDKGPELPEARFGMAVATLPDSVMACGGFNQYERSECYIYTPHDNQWRLETQLPSEPLLFASAASIDGDYYLAGGRFYNHSSSQWIYSDKVWRYSRRTMRWTSMPNLETPTADACMVALQDTKKLALIGGSSGEYRYAHDPNLVVTLDVGYVSHDSPYVKPINEGWNEHELMALLAPRMWHSCTTATINDETGILVVGGYYNGDSAMFLPLEPRVKGWRWVASLPEDRKWGPSLGVVGKSHQLLVSGGQDYGDDTVDMHTSIITDGRDKKGMKDGGTWYRSSSLKMTYRREFASHTTVPRSWFPYCEF